MSYPESHPRIYAVTEFHNPPLRDIPYTELGLVTRANFASLLEKSFSASRGDLGYQALYFEWLMVNTGFGYRRSLHAFLDAGGWKCLTEREKRKLKEAFRMVRGHRVHMNAWERFQKDPESEFNVQIRNVLDFAESGYTANLVRDFERRGIKLFGLSRGNLSRIFSSR